MKTLLLIDANALIHRSFHAMPPLTTPSGEPIQAIYGLSRILLKLFRENPPAGGFDYVAALFDRPEKTFRKEKYVEYKATRPKAPDELVSQIIKAREVFQKFHVKTIELPGFEADDLIGTLTEKFKKQKDVQVVILSGDMDLLQLVEDGKVAVRTFKKGIGETTTYHEAEVKERYGLTPAQLPDFKAVSGDPSDNIPGISGVGPKTITPLLQKYGTIENLYKHLDPKEKWYEKFAPHKKEVLLFKELTTIHRNVPVRLGGIEELQRQPLDIPELNAYFQTLGFKSLAEEAGGEKGKKEPRAKRAGGPKKDATKKDSASQSGLPILGNQTLVAKIGGVTVGFELKKVKELQEPYFDIGIAAWLIEPDLRDYGPGAVFHKFLKKEWRGSEENLKEAFEWAKKKLTELELERVFYEIEMPLLAVLGEIERYGVAIDLEKARALRKELQKETNRLQKQIYKDAGEEFNLNSPKQLSSILFEKLHIIPPRGMKTTPQGLMSTNVENLTLLRDAHPVIKSILEFRTAFKMLSTYVDPILERADKKGRLHTSFVQTGTATGRLSSENPNLQNLPVATEATEESMWGTKLRDVFVADEGTKLVAFDYSQLELRILASVSADKEMTRIFKNGEDIHTMTASEIFTVPLGRVTKEMRRVAKTLNFGVAYGMGSSAFAKVAGVSREEAKKFIEKYYEAFSSVRIWQEKMRSEGRKYGYVKTLTGRKRPIPDILSGAPQFAARAERVAINMPIQGLGADIIKYAMIGVRKELAKKKWWGSEAKMLLSIHDELLFEVRDDMIKEIAPVILNAMESAYVLTVPLAVNASQGTTWAHLVSFKAQGGT